MNAAAFGARANLHGRSGGQGEARDGFAQHARLILQRLRRGGRLFDERGVLLGHFIHFADRAIDLFDARALLA